jgi:hypothetical protein
LPAPPGPVGGRLSGTRRARRSGPNPISESDRSRVRVSRSQGTTAASWGCGAVGSALRSQRRGQGFESPQLHEGDGEVCPRKARSASPSSFVRLRFACRGRGLGPPRTPCAIASLGRFGWPPAVLVGLRFARRLGLGASRPIVALSSPTRAFSCRKANTFTGVPEGGSYIDLVTWRN